MKMSPLELSRIYWDVVVIGTGMGGATLGHALAKGGQKVLFLEKGLNYLENPQALRGDYMECFIRDRADVNTEDAAQNSGRWRGEIFDAVRKIYTRPMLGQGVGGSTALYGMALERFFPSDFTPKRFHQGDNNESTLPDRWPVTYAEMRPYYERAEDLYRVHSETPDPCRGGEVFHHLKKESAHHLATQLFEKLIRFKKLHPYSVPLACDWKEDCRFCQSILCDKDCKNDAAKICLKPAIDLFNAALVTQFYVDRLNLDNGKITSVEGVWQGQQKLQFRGRTIVLAAGALATPLILMRSRSAQQPDGLANESGYVGRNLMRHLIDIYLLPSIWNFAKTKVTLKEVAWNDFYEVNGVKYGTFQPLGKFPPGFIAMDEVLYELKQTMPAWATKMFSSMLPVYEKLFDLIVQRSGCAAPILEDLPHWENRVEAMAPSADGRERIAVHYRISQYDAKRLAAFRKMVSKALFPFLVFRIPASQSVKLLAHACGTARFGDDPATSVLNKNNRAHSINNLYVVDASFFPSSGGVNPSLTLAANSLRVADHLMQQSFLS